MSVGQSKAIRARQGKMERMIGKAKKIVDERNAFGTDFQLFVGNDRVPLSEFKFTPVQEIEPEMLTTFTTSNLVIEGEVTMTPEQQAEMSKWWADIINREIECVMLGRPSEFQHSLRAAGRKV